MSIGIRTRNVYFYMLLMGVPTTTMFLEDNLAVGIKGLKIGVLGNSLVVQWLELRALNAVGSIPGVGIKTLRDTQRAPPQSLSRMTSAVPQHPPLRTGVPGAALPSFPPTSFALCIPSV